MTAMDTNMVNINQETLFDKMEFSYVVPVEDLKHIYPYIKSLFCATKIPSVQLAGRLKNFIENWKILTNDTEIVIISGGLYKTISKHSSTEKYPKLSQIKSGRKDASTEGNSKMLSKGPIVKTPNHLEGESSSNLFLVEKKDAENLSSINLKHLNQVIP